LKESRSAVQAFASVTRAHGPVRVDQTQATAVQVVPRLSGYPLTGSDAIRVQELSAPRRICGVQFFTSSGVLTLKKSSESLLTSVAAFSNLRKFAQNARACPVGTSLHPGCSDDRLVLHFGSRSAPLDTSKRHTSSRTQSWWLCPGLCLDPKLSA
jgi:hypothetical protein